MTAADITEKAIPVAACITKMLDISTGHIPKHTADSLGEKDSKVKPPLWDSISYVHYHEYGWIIHCTSTPEEDLKGEHQELVNLIKIASANGATHLKLDCDAPVAEGLPVFNW